MANELQLLTGGDDDKVPVAPGLGAMLALVLSAGEPGAYRFLEFFAAHLRNPNTRAAYFRNACAFFLWCQRRKIRELSEIRSHHVAGYVERLGNTHAPPSVKQHLAAIRMLFDWLVIGQIVAHNPASAVRGPTYVVNKGKTPVLLGEEARVLLDSIQMDTLMGLQDRGPCRKTGFGEAGLTSRVINSRGPLASCRRVVAPNVRLTAYTTVLTRDSWWCARSAQAIRAFLLAKATAAPFVPRRPMSAVSHRLRSSRFESTQRSVARAPCTNSVRR
jgi:hypothetical protein